MVTGSVDSLRVNTIFKAGWYCDCCIDYARSEVAAGRRPPESGLI